MTHYQLIRYQTVGKHRLILLIVSLFTGLTMAYSQGSLATKSVQTTGKAPLPDEIFTVVEVQPEFPGGIPKFQDYIRKNLRYPEKAVNAKVEGKVFISFLIMNDGSIQDVIALKGLGYGTDDEAVRLVQSMPNWIPGKQSGRPVNVRYNVVIPFILSDAK